MEPERIEPQPGPQSAFFSTLADVAIYGGAAGGGKTFALLLEPLRHVTTNKRFSAVFFRRTTTQIKNPGGLWDESMHIYPKVGGVPKIGVLEWHWPKGGKLKMAHLEHEQTKLEWQGSQIPLLLFDELTHFTASQFFYMVSRNRSMSGVSGYIRATCNPDADSWVAEFISWWIDQESGLPIRSRAGKLRWFLRINDSMDWADTKSELVERWRGKIPDETLQPKSVTFIPAQLSDNKALMQADPGYMANLLAMSTVERERMLYGNWRIRPSAGLYFQRKWLKEIPEPPDSGVRWVRGWDLAATPKTDNNNPDFTESVRLGRTDDGKFIIADHTWMRGTPAEVESEIRRTAFRDGRSVLISLPQDPGQAGVAQKAQFARLLEGFNVRCTPESRTLQASGTAQHAKSAKISRFGPFSAQCEAGNVSIVRGPWNGEFFERLEAFPMAIHDDTADACSRAFGQLTTALPARRIKMMLRR
jgi:predicted phage terminase large subunit-like protein